MRVELFKTQDYDKLFLKRMMIDAYDDDALLHTGGDYFTDNADDFFEKITNGENEFYLIKKGEKIIGALSIKNTEILSIFIDSFMHNFGYGEEVIKLVDELYKKDLTVKIPGYSKRLYHFFRKCGFRVLNEDTLNYEENIIMEKKYE